MPLETVHFEDFELDRSTYELRRGGSIIHLERIPFDLLNLLVERHGQMVARQEILEQIWGKTCMSTPITVLTRRCAKSGRRCTTTRRNRDL